MPALRPWVRSVTENTPPAGEPVPLDGRPWSAEPTLDFGNAEFSGSRVNFDEDALQSPTALNLSGAIFDGGEVWVGDELLTESPQAPPATDDPSEA